MSIHAAHRPVAHSRPLLAYSLSQVFEKCPTLADFRRHRYSFDWAVQASIYHNFTSYIAAQKARKTNSRIVSMDDAYIHCRDLVLERTRPGQNPPPSRPRPPAAHLPHLQASLAALSHAGPASGNQTDASTPSSTSSPADLIVPHTGLGSRLSGHQPRAHPAAVQPASAYHALQFTPVSVPPPPPPPVVTHAQSTQTDPAPPPPPCPGCEVWRGMYEESRRLEPSEQAAAVAAPPTETTEEQSAESMRRRLLWLEQQVARLQEHNDWLRRKNARLQAAEADRESEQKMEAEQTR